MVDFTALKKKSQEIQKNGIGSAYKDTFSKKSYEDDTFWSITRDKAGNGSAIIRFLPNPEGNSSLNLVKYYDHFFKVEETGNYYIENSLTTFDTTDYIQHYVNYLWKHDEDLARKYKRRTNFVSNILIVDDPAVPENNGKVFKFKFGTKIFDKIKEMICPEFPNATPVDVFDPWIGANFLLRVKLVAKFPNYDSSKFDTTSAIGTDEEILKVLEQCYDLSYIANRDGVYQGKPFYKTEDELKQSFIKAFGSDLVAQINGIPEDLRYKEPKQAVQEKTQKENEEISKPQIKETIDNEQDELDELFSE